MRALRGLPRRLRIALPLPLLLATAAGCSPPPREFDESAAWRHLETQVAFGPRIPGSQGHANTLAYLREHLEACADAVSIDTFDGVCALDSTAMTLHNVVAVFRPDAPRRLLFGAHWDTRPFADQDPDESRRRDPVPGANDGASGVAILLEVASALKTSPPGVGVDLVFFDGEDCGTEADADSWALGSQRFVAANPRYRPAYAVVVDMVGRKGMVLPKEGNSVAVSGPLTHAIWREAARLGEPAFVDSVARPVWDDHIAFLKAGIPAVDLIDFDDPHWHTTSDLPEHCAPASLGQVGRLLLALVRKAEEAESP
jgi:Peptidase family M28